MKDETVDKIEENIQKAQNLLEEAARLLCNEPGNTIGGKSYGLGFPASQGKLQNHLTTPIDLEIRKKHMATIYTYNVKLRILPKNGKSFDVFAVMGGSTYIRAAMHAVTIIKQWYPECKVEVK